MSEGYDTWLAGKERAEQMAFQPEREILINELGCSEFSSLQP